MTRGRTHTRLNHSTHFGLSLQYISFTCLIGSFMLVCPVENHIQLQYQQQHLVFWAKIKGRKVAEINTKDACIQYGPDCIASLQGLNDILNRIFRISFVLLGQACSALGGFAPNPSDCSSFLVCNHDKYIVQPCAIGLHWDNKIKVCNSIELAGCEPGMYIFFLYRGSSNYMDFGT